MSNEYSDLSKDSAYETMKKNHFINLILQIFFRHVLPHFHDTID